MLYNKLFQPTANVYNENDNWTLATPEQYWRWWYEYTLIDYILSQENHTHTEQSRKGYPKYAISLPLAVPWLFLDNFWMEMWGWEHFAFPEAGEGERKAESGSAAGVG